MYRRDECLSLGRCIIDETEVAESLAEFDGLWESLAPREQSRVVELPVERVTNDGHASTLSITYRPTGISSLASELTAMKKEEAA